MIETALMCMALNIYHEARGESLAGQIAVSQVVMNRVASPRFPDTVCGVVKQAKYHAWSDIPIRNKCHFSWWCDGLSDKPQDDEAMLRATILAQNILEGRITNISEGATHYHANYVMPYWADEMTQVLQIEQHIFYK